MYGHLWITERQGEIDERSLFGLVLAIDLYRQISRALVVSNPCLSLVNEALERSRRAVGDAEGTV